MRKHGDSEAEKLGSVWVSMKYASPKGYLTSNVSTEPTDATNPAHGPHNTALIFFTFLGFTSEILPFRILEKTGFFWNANLY